MSTVATYSYTHSVTYVTDNILKSLKDIIVLSGLDPEHFADRWESNTRAIKTWLGTGDLRKVVLEIYNPSTDKLVTRWDIDIVYGWSDGDGSFWTDTEQLKYAIKKAGLLPSQAKYKVMLDTKPGRPDVEGGAKEAIARRMGWSSRAWARLSNIVAWRVRPDIGGNADAVDR